MNKFQFLFVLTSLVAFASKGYGQMLNFNIIDKIKFIAVYDYKAVVDLTDKSFVFKDEMHLQVGYRNSRFVSAGVLHFDSLALKSQSIQIFMEEAANSLADIVNFSQVYKNTENRKVTLTGRLDFYTSFKTSEPMNQFSWVIKNEKTSYLGYTVQKATTSYGCRTWEALFAPGIPVSEGPYKFHGLPGLILKVMDTEGHYSFELRALYHAQSEANLYDTEDFNFVKLTRTDWMRILKNPLPFFPEHIKDHSRPRSTLLKVMQPKNPIELCAD